MSSPTGISSPLSFSPTVSSSPLSASSPYSQYSLSGSAASSPYSQYSLSGSAASNTLPYYLGSSQTSSPLNQFTTSTNAFLNSSQNWLNQYQISNGSPVTVPLINGQPATTLPTTISPSRAIGNFANGLQNLVPAANSTASVLNTLAALKNGGEYPSSLSVTPTTLNAGGVSVPYTISQPSQPINITTILLIGGILVATVLFVSMI